MYRRNQSKMSIHLWRYIMYCNCYVILIIEGNSVGRRHMRLLIRLRRNPELWFWVLLVPLGSLSLKDMTGAPPTTRHGHLRHQRHEGLILRRCHVQKLNCFAGFLWLPGAIEGFGKKLCRWGKKRRATLIKKILRKLRVSHCHSHPQDWSTKISDLEAAFSFYYFACLFSLSRCQALAASDVPRQQQLLLGSRDLKCFEHSLSSSSRRFEGRTNFQQGRQWKLKFIVKRLGDTCSKQNYAFLVVLRPSFLRFHEMSLVGFVVTAHL